MLPYQVGKFYKAKDYNALAFLRQISRFPMVSTDYGHAGINAQLYYTGDSTDSTFLPIAFIDNTQKIILQALIATRMQIPVMVPSQNNYNYSNGLQINMDRVNFDYDSVVYYEIDVNEFIKNFDLLI